MPETPPTKPGSLLPIVGAVFFTSLSLILYELLLTRLFAVVLFAQFAHLALALALLGVSVGAVLQHLWPGIIPRAGYERRVGWMALLLAVTVVIAVLAVIHLPVVKGTSDATLHFQERSGLKEELLNPGWFLALLPVLALPFLFGGLTFSGIFQRLKDQISRVYAADLVGGALGAVLFIPVLQTLAGPDTVFVVTLSAGVAALLAFHAAGHRLGRILGIVLIGLSLLAVGASRAGGELIRIRQAAGYDEDKIHDVRWTALTRLCLYEAGNKVKLLLDNTSASEVVRTADDLVELDACMSRSIVYRLHEPGGRVAILGASAGPEVAVAQSHGFSDIEAVDIASEGFELVAEKYPDAPLNPYRQPGVRRVHADGRAAIMRSREPYDIIQMVHANLWSVAGLMSNAWSPALIETREAFAAYLDKLRPGGTISFGRGDMTIHEVRAAAAALRARGVKNPYKHIAWVDSSCQVMLLKAEPWTEAERARLFTAAGAYRTARVVLDPGESKPPDDVLKRLRKGPVMTDDRPYLDTADMVPKAFKQLFRQASGRADSPMAVLYMSIVIQVLFVLGAGVLFVLVPWIWRGRSEMAGLKGGLGVLAYVAGLGYGYLAVETVLIHQLVLFVGHPTYAVTLVVLAMLLGSGLGSAFTHRFVEGALLSRLRVVLLGVLLLGALQTFVVPPLLHAIALDAVLWLRLLLTFLCVFPLGFVMGMPFPLGIRLLRPETAGIVPWAWAVNGWMSVAASLVTVLISRIYGYSYALVIALIVYGVCLLLTGRLPRLRLGSSDQG
jgi:hypothetical protein